MQKKEIPATSLPQYFKAKIEEAEQLLAEKMEDVRRLQAQRNERNNKVETIFSSLNKF
jgi:hypothetical protein